MNEGFDSPTDDVLNITESEPLDPTADYETHPGDLLDDIDVPRSVFLQKELILNTPGVRSYEVWKNGNLYCGHLRNDEGREIRGSRPWCEFTSEGALIAALAKSAIFFRKKNNLKEQ